jgi:hypothetical protein
MTPSLPAYSWWEGVLFLRGLARYPTRQTSGAETPPRYEQCPFSTLTIVHSKKAMPFNNEKIED